MSRSKEGDKTYGSQLDKAATDRYESLVKQGLEKGVEKSGKFYFEDVAEIGIDVETGSGTKIYRLDGAPNGAHVIPVPAMPK